MSESPRVLLIGLQEMVVEATRTFVDLGYTCLVFVPADQWSLVERFKLDELAETAGKDPVEFRLEMLKDHPRHAAVLKLAAEKAGWGKSMPKGKGIGIAVHESFNSFVAQR